MKVLGGIGAAISAPAIVPASALGRDGAVTPSARIRLGVIGVNGMGRENLKNCAQYDDVVVTGVCDVWKKRRDEVLAQHPTARGYLDYQELLAADDIDAVIIATPPHWHALMAIRAFETGKDVYGEKPLCYSIPEGRAMLDALEKHRRVFQLGTQIHAGENYHRVV